MLDLISEASTLGALLEETRGVTGVVLGTVDGEVRTVVGSFLDGDATAATAATVVVDLGRIGELLGLGALGVASLRAPTANRVFAHQGAAVLAIELDPKRPIGELETKLLTLDWAPDEIEPPVHRAPTASFERPSSQTLPPPVPATPAISVTAPRTITVEPPALPAPPAPSRRAPTAETVTPVALPAAPRTTSATKPPPLPNTTPRPSRTTTRPPPPNRVNRSSPYPNVPVKSVGSGPVFTGDLEEFCLPDLLEFLRNSHRTGLLVCTAAAGIGKIQLSRGMIIAAESPNALDLRQHFLDHPDLTPERKRTLAGLPAECFSDDVIDGVLGSRDLVPRDEIEQARVARIYSAFREMMRWTVGRFSFDPGVAVVTNPALALSAQSILMHIYQEQDEQGR